METPHIILFIAIIVICLFLIDVYRKNNEMVPDSYKQLVDGATEFALYEPHDNDDYCSSCRTRRSDDYAIKQWIEEKFQGDNCVVDKMEEENQNYIKQLMFM